MSALFGTTATRKIGLIALLLAVVAVSIAIHGYHYGIEDEAIYLPAIKAHLNPALYPHDGDFFKPQTRPTLFDDLVAASSRLLHAPVDCTVFAYYLGTLFLFYGGLWAFAGRIFPGTSDRLGGLLLISVLLTLPVAGTGLYIVDQHLHPRTLATALILFASALVLPRSGRKGNKGECLWAALLMSLAMLIHLQMAFYGLLFLAALLLPPRLFEGKPALAAVLVPGLLGTMLASSSPEWQEAARTRTAHYLMLWQWYEWLGAIAPIFLLWAMAWLAARRDFPVAAFVAKRTALFAAVGFAAGCIITIPPQLERLTPFQPLRTLHLTYIVMLLLVGGMLAEFILRQKPWRWALLLLPIAAGMTFAQLNLFPSSPHIEWPERPTGNHWVEAFDWIKANTPLDAYFVLDPYYMHSPGEDYHGFRGLAERGQMADRIKDPGVALLFPALAPRWSREVHALDRWKGFTAEDFHRLHQQFGVDWTVLPVSGANLPDCPYRNHTVKVCRIR